MEVLQERSNSLYDRVRDSEALGTLIGIEYQLTALLTPDGKKNHRVTDLRSGVVLRIEMMEKGHWLPRTATISDYRAREPLAYEKMIEEIEKAERDFRISPEMVMHRAAVA